MENSRPEGSRPAGQEINADFRGNRGKYPDSKEVLEKDLIDENDVGTEDGQIVTSRDPESQEWNAREDVQEEHRGEGEA